MLTVAALALVIEVLGCSEDSREEVVKEVSPNSQVVKEALPNSRIVKEVSPNLQIPNDASPNSRIYEVKIEAPKLPNSPKEVVKEVSSNSRIYEVKIKALNLDPGANKTRNSWGEEDPDPFLRIWVGGSKFETETYDNTTSVVFHTKNTVQIPEKEGFKIDCYDEDSWSNDLIFSVNVWGKEFADVKAGEEIKIYTDPWGKRIDDLKKLGNEIEHYHTLTIEFIRIENRERK